MATERERAEQAIREGGSYISGNRQYTKISDLPNEAEFAIISGNKEQELKVAESLDLQIQSLLAQKALLAKRAESEAAVTEVQQKRVNAEVKSPAAPSKTPKNESSGE